MNAKQLNRLLVDNFPELEGRYHDEVDWQEGDNTGSHVVYGDVFSPYIETLIVEKIYIELEKVFAFIESIVELDDNYCNEVIIFSVLERLVADEKSLLICKQYFGKRTKMLFDEL